MRIDILTLFPGICDGALSESIVQRARERALVEIRTINIRDFTTDRHRVTDDTPYGGGQGMVMKPEPIFAAVESVRAPDSRVILLSPRGRIFDQRVARELAAIPHLVLVCGHYEGVDQRVADHLADEELSIGDYVLTNGAIAACVVADAVVRLLPGVLGHARSAEDDSFERGLLEHPQYTRPADFRGWTVPEILLGGNHAAIAAWRLERSIEITRRNRPDLLGESRPPANHAGT